MRSRSDVAWRAGRLACVALVLVVLPAAAGAKKRQYTVDDQKTGKALTAAVELLQADQPAEAEKALARMRMDKLNPYEAALVYQIRGSAAASLEKYEDAAKHFQAALDQEALPPAAQAQIRFTVAQLQLMFQHYDEAIANFEKWFSEVEAPSPHAYYMLAIAYYQGGHPDKALKPALKAVENPETAKEAWLQLVFALYSADKRFAEGLPYLERLVSRFPKKTYWMQLAAIYAALGEDQKSLAVQQLAYAQGLLTTDHELRRLARMYLYNDLPYRAARVMQKGLKDGSVESDSEAWKLLGDSWLAARNYDLALEPLTKAASLAKDGQLYVRLGQVYVQREAWPEALVALEKGIQKGGLDDPGNAHLLIGIARYNQNEFLAARNAFAKARGDEKWEAAATRWMDFIDREQARRG